MRRCKCNCGRITNPGKKYISGHHSRINHPNYSHGLTQHKLHPIWKSMRQRCYNTNAKQYEDYGGRGIRVCIRWRRSFKLFYNWAIKNGYKEGLSINRIDNDGNYTLDNCNFVTREYNNLNQRIRKDNKTGYTGIYFFKRYSKYGSVIQTRKKRKFLGYYKTVKQAVVARDQYILNNNLPNKLSGEKS